MPHANHFRHQPYHAAQPQTSVEVLDKSHSGEPKHPDDSSKLAQAFGAYRDSQLATVFLVHGTFTGNDALGTLTELQRLSPRLAERLRGWLKGTVDAIVGETGNYTTEFAARLQTGLTAATGRDIPVQLFHWSSQNNHIARADGAVRLIARLAEVAERQETELSSPQPPRVMLWGHSHGGNVLALVTNLIAADPTKRQEFFEAARVFYQPWLRNEPDMPCWQRVEKLLETDHPVRRLPLDIVTFGTPIRYGWESRGYRNLLHFVNHRPSGSLPTHRTHFPLRPWHFLTARHGDYIHQLGIAGTNMMPVPLAVRTFIADCRLQSVLQNGVTWFRLLRRYALGQRIHQEGHTLLVNYNDQGWRLWHHLAGHAVYTRSSRLPFHLAEIGKRFYGTSATTPSDSE